MIIESRKYFNKYINKFLEARKKKKISLFWISLPPSQDKEVEGLLGARRRVDDQPDTGSADTDHRQRTEESNNITYFYKKLGYHLFNNAYNHLILKLSSQNKLLFYKIFKYDNTISLV